MRLVGVEVVSGGNVVDSLDARNDAPGRRRPTPPLRMPRRMSPCPLLNHHCQLVRVDEGRLDANSRCVRAGAHTIYVGDEIATRDNNRRLLTDRGRMVRNRAEWTVTAIHADGSVNVDGRSGRIRLPSEYVALVRHAELNPHTTPDVTISHSRQILADWRGRPVRRTPADRHPGHDERSHSRRILDHWQGRDLRRTVDDHRSTVRARSGAEGFTPTPDHVDTADVSTPNEELRRQLRQLRAGRQSPSFGPEIEL